MQEQCREQYVVQVPLQYLKVFKATSKLSSIKIPTSTFINEKVGQPSASDWWTDTGSVAPHPLGNYGMEVMRSHAKLNVLALEIWSIDYTTTPLDL